ncbi:hypothetical protein [Haploplasma axanthum]|uniref:Uncharacterized protein n=1 Tax=Haploplasma axanthum TaxID=29552 RepID=A0A449BBX9_HAPAX|nr:hypothetical protein [Haploplasma axanthum]VEU79932.1 Uncharacterised protein [Haploplasma axanthum]
MQKRKSPLEAEKTQTTTLNKRVNPLELKETVIETKEVVKAPKETFVPFKIEQKTSLKRKFIITRLSKDVFEALKTVYPNEKTALIIDNALLAHLYSVDKKKYEAVVSKLKGKDVK